MHVIDYSNLFATDELYEMLRSYNNGGYDHLIDNPREPLDLEIIRKSVDQYFKLFLNERSEDDEGLINERKHEIEKMIKNRDDIETRKKFLNLMCNNQYFKEPLAHIVNNQGNIPLWFK